MAKKTHSFWKLTVCADFSISPQSNCESDNILYKKNQMFGSDFVTKIT